MAFMTKKDYFAVPLGDTVASKLAITSSDENKSASTAQAIDEKGDIVAEEIFGETTSPSCSYVLKDDVEFGGITTGKSFDVDGKKVSIGRISISTNAGQAPTITITGEELPASASTHQDCYYELPTCTVKKCFHAQDDVLGEAFTMTGDGCYLTSATYDIGGDIVRATKDGETVSYDIANGQMSISLTIQGTNDNRPEIIAGDGWSITSPVTKSHGDASYPTYTATLTHPLRHKVQG